MAAKKLSINLTDKNREFLEKIKTDQPSPYGVLINTLISTFCGIPMSVRTDLLEFIRPKINELFKQMDTAGEFNLNAIKEDIRAYTDIASFFNKKRNSETKFGKKLFMIPVLNSQKFTIDLTDQNRDLLEEIKTDQRLPYGTTINILISTFCNVPLSVKKEFLDFIKLKLRNLYQQMDAAGEFNFVDISEQAQSYLDIAKFFNNGIRYSAADIDAIPNMVKIPILNGTLICPVDVILINPEAAISSAYACIIECRNSHKYGIPHFVYFSNIPSVYEYDNTYEKTIYSECQKIYPRFDDILTKQVEPIYDPDHPGFLLNFCEWNQAPTIYFYDIYVQGDPKYGPDYDPPLNIRIIRSSGQKQE